MATQGGSVLPVKVITDSDLVSNGGQYLLRGGPAIPVVGMIEDDLVSSDVIIDGVNVPVYVVDDTWPGRIQGGSARRMVSWTSAPRKNDGRVAQPVYVVSGDLGSEAPFVGFSLSDIVFTPAMDIRTGQAGVFDGAPIVQGNFASAGDVTDVLTAPRGNQFGNPVGFAYDNADPYQGSASFWITPEWDGDDAETHQLVYGNVGNGSYITKHTGNYLAMWLNDQFFVGPSTAAWTAGTTYHVLVRWDFKNTLDGTNYACFSVDDSHSFGVTTQPTVEAPRSSLRLGTNNGAGGSANAIIEGLTIGRRVLFDGTYGCPTTFDSSGPVDEVAAIYAAGAGKDPAQVLGSWDTCFFLPTNSQTDEALGDNPDEHAWSHPHSSNLPNDWTMHQGEAGIGPYMLEFDAVDDDVDCGSGATLDDLADNAFTANAWIRPDSYGEGNAGSVFDKSAAGTVGWRMTLHAVLGLYAEVSCATIDATSRLTAADFPIDGKAHYITMFFDDAGDRKIYIAIDGKWASSYAVQTAGSGAIVSDASENLVLGGNGAGAFTFDGGIGWASIYSDDHHVAGTDFIPPRTVPGVGGNLVEAWPVNEGTGATAAAVVTSPGNDGTITGATWSSQWDQEGTPMVVPSLAFDALATRIKCGSGATLDDLPSSANGFMLGGWFRADGEGENNIGTFFSKNGYECRFDSGLSRLFLTMQYDGTDATTRVAYNPTGGIWHQLIVSFEDPSTGDGKIYVAIDGIWTASYVTQTAAVGNYVSDAASEFVIGNIESAAERTFEGGAGWFAIWNTANQYTVGSNFVPLARTSPPGAGGNLIEAWPMNEGAGLTVAATVTTPGNDGTIDATGGTAIWQNTTDMSVDEPGARIYPWGYNLGSDGANDGITQIITGLSAGDDHVLRVPISYGQSGVAQPAIQVYDESNTAIISTLTGPPMTGAHDGGDDSATLIDSAARWPQMMVGWKLYNLTDGSETTITAASGDMTTLTGVLAGGTGDDWDDGDVYLLRPPGGAPYSQFPWVETFCVELPAGCTSISWKVLNAAGDGMLQVHQYEVLASLVTTGSMETGAGDPYIPTGWTSRFLDAGDSATEGTVVHSGAASVKFASSWTINEGFSIDLNPAPSNDQFVMMGCWSQGDADADAIAISAREDVRGLLHSDASERQISGHTDEHWVETVGVWRQPSSTMNAMIISPSSASNDRYVDDIYAIVLDAVTLTVTPASEANSLESGGIRVDGRDGSPQTPDAGLLTATTGIFKWRTAVRHADADALKFGETTPYFILARFDATNYIRVRWTAASTIQIEVVIGGASTTDTWATGGFFTVDTLYSFELEYSATQLTLKVSDVIRATATPGGGINFGANIPNLIYWGSDNTPAQHLDAVFAAPI